MKFKYSDGQINTKTDRKILGTLNEVDWNSTKTITGHVVPAKKPQEWVANGTVIGGVMYVEEDDE
ncbi:hypothetical protein OXT66_05775 [Lentilactobacillus senioris]|uniref:hypothetical protein n=1 Tax=Lentilactobacillus senioris TaxID=931534 RepID=UPI0022804F53|nr:hypothetical protein [Lentilactobacillus senioris]MCY9807058.1 hypothetical protein [Lentilactobacillus senioris]